MNIWDEVEKLKGQTLRTLDQSKPFDIVEVTEYAVIVRPHKSNAVRLISRDEIEDAAKRLIAVGQLTRTEVHAEFSEFNTAYVAAVLAELPNVKHSIRPIKLWITE
jgi:hypothetical protein